jgi:hypothetical protein
MSGAAEQTPAKIYEVFDTQLLDAANRLSPEEKCSPAALAIQICELEGVGALTVKPMGRSMRCDTFMVEVCARLDFPESDRQILLPKSFKLSWDKDMKGGRPQQEHETLPGYFNGCPEGRYAVAAKLKQLLAEFRSRRPTDDEIDEARLEYEAFATVLSMHATGENTEELKAAS